MAEKFTLEMNARAHEKYENVKVVPVNLDINGELKVVELEIYKIFSPVKIQQCVREFMENIDKARKINKGGFGDIGEPYLMWLIIKHFSELEESMPTKFEEQVNSLMQMIETSALFQIMVHFDTEQIKLIKEQLEVVLATFEGNKEEFEKFKRKFKEDLKDKSLLS